MGNQTGFVAAIALALASCKNPGPRIASLPEAGGGEVSADAAMPPTAAEHRPDASTPARDSGSLDADAAREPTGGSREAGSGGGGAQAAGVGGVVPEAGQGGDATPDGGGAGASAPADQVLWSQTWTVPIHTAVSHPAIANAQMGLFVDGGEDCRFWEHVPAASGTSQTIATDAACLREASARGSAVIFDGELGKGSAGSAPLVGWDAAVSGHTVNYLRRTVTYSISVQGADDTSYNYADFSALLEAVGR